MCQVYLCAARGDRPKPKKPHQLKDDAPSGNSNRSFTTSLSLCEIERLYNAVFVVVVTLH